MRFEFPFVSRGLLHATEGDRDYAISRRKEAEQAAINAARQAQALRDLLAEHIVAAEHPSSEASSAAAMATALREAIDAHGIDLTRELTQLGGA
jgi:hypothetical protein